MNPRPILLVIEPDPETCQQLALVLMANGFQVMEAVSGVDGYAQAVFHPPDLIILETELPDMDGNELCLQLHRRLHVPILVLSARRNERDIVEALDSGADDYLTKPFQVGELLARIRVALRRDYRQKPGTSFRIGTIELDLERHLVRKNGQEVKLTVTEFRLLAYLMQNAGKLVTYPMILSEVWGTDSSGNAHALRVHINHLRKKLESVPYLPSLIITEPHIGYRFAG